MINYDWDYAQERNIVETVVRNHGWDYAQERNIVETVVRNHGWKFKTALRKGMGSY